jgi:hypothetical protein
MSEKLDDREGFKRLGKPGEKLVAPTNWQNATRSFHCLLQLVARFYERAKQLSTEGEKGSRAARDA